MALKTIYLLRHGKPELIDNQRRFIGQTDLPLSKVGVQQANAIGKVMKNKNIEAVYSSDLKRSIQTAEIIAEHHAFNIQQVPALREIHLGKWEGFTFAEIAQLYPKEFKERGQDIGYFRPPEGENFMDLSNRVLPAFEAINQKGHECVVIVGHAGVNRMILCNLLGVSLSNMFKMTQDYGCINILSGNEKEWRLKSLNMKLASN